MKTLRLLFLAFVLAIPARAQVHLLVTTNGGLLGPADFFTANSAAITTLSSGVYQPVDADLTAFAGISAVAGDVIYHNGTNWVRLPKGTDGQTLQLSSGFPTWATVVGGGAGDVTLAGTNAFTGPNSFAGTTTFNGAANLNGTTTISNLTVPGTMTVGSVSFGTPLGLSGGGHGATTAAGARTNLGVVIGYDVQAQDPILQDLADLSLANGDMLLFNGTDLTALATTTAGRALLTAATASAQWAALLPDAVLGGSYNAGTFDGVTNKAVTPDQFHDVIAALPGGSNAITTWNTNYFSVSGGYLDFIGSTGGGGGVEWLVNEPLGSWYGRDSTTNWPLLSVTISSNDLPTAAGKYIFGQISGIVSNLTGASATIYFNADVNGTRVFRDSQSVAGVTVARGRPYVGNFFLIYETSTTASLVCLGVQTTSSNPEIGGSGDLANSANGLTFIATNIAVNWSSNVTLALGFECDTVVGSPTNAALGMRKVYASLLKYTDGTSGTGDVVGPESSTTNNIAVFADATGKVIADGGVAIAELATEAEVAAGYQPLDDDLTDLADGSLTGSKVGSGIDAGNITTGTLSSNRLPAAVSFTTVDVGTINATAVVGDASGLTGINATNITAGELADARIPAAIARDSEVSATYAPLASPALTGDPTAPTASANDNDTSIATTAYVQAEETALKAANLWQATNGNLTTLAGASITGAGNFMRTRTGVPREIWIPASAMNPGTDAPTPATNTWATTTDGQRWEGWDFSASATNSVYFTLALPTAWDGGPVKAKLLWKQVVAAATATNSWQIGGGSLTDGDTGGNTLGTLVEVLDVGANDTNVVSVSAASGAITIGGTPSAGHLTWFTVRRHPGDDDDNFAQLSRLIGVHLQYTETATEPSAW
jgi:hypothetical protein